MLDMTFMVKIEIALQSNKWRKNMAIELGYSTLTIFDGFRKDAQIDSSKAELERVMIEKRKAKLEYEKEIADLLAF